jgi:hypothetical protein
MTSDFLVRLVDNGVRHTQDQQVWLALNLGFVLELLPLF